MNKKTTSGNKLHEAHHAERKQRSGNVRKGGGRHSQEFWMLTWWHTDANIFQCQLENATTFSFLPAAYHNPPQALSLKAPSITHLISQMDPVASCTQSQRGNPASLSALWTDLAPGHSSQALRGNMNGISSRLLPWRWLIYSISTHWLQTVRYAVWLAY